MEIWPVGHYSPVHSHAGAHAVIRVLHGSIHTKLYPFLCAEKDTADHFSATDFPKNSITWISPTLNQVHKLENLDSNKEPCITIQCYMYDDENKQHYDYFDYIDSDGVKQQYEPDSDMEFLQFKELMKQEWLAKADKKAADVQAAKKVVKEATNALKAAVAATTSPAVDSPCCVPSFWCSTNHAAKKEKKNQ